MCLCASPPLLGLARTCHGLPLLPCIAHPYQCHLLEYVPHVRDGLGDILPIFQCTWSTHAPRKRQDHQEDTKPAPLPERPPFRVLPDVLPKWPGRTAGGRLQLHPPCAPLAKDLADIGDVRDVGVLLVPRTTDPKRDGLRPRRQAL